MSRDMTKPANPAISDQPWLSPSLISLHCELNGKQQAKDLSSLHADSKDYDQNGLIPRLI